MKKLCFSILIYIILFGGSAYAQATWDTSALKGKPKTESLPNFTAPNEQVIVNTPPQTIDESEELLYIDRAFADNIYDKGALIAYTDAISDEGVLFDASGGTQPGKISAETRFKGFPAEIKLERRPERAMASHGAGATWGTYAVKRGAQVLAEGRYTAIWRKENGIWKIVNELAAGKSAAPPSLPQKAKTPQPNTDNLSAPNNPAILRDALGRPVTPKPKPANN